MSFELPYPGSPEETEEFEAKNQEFRIFLDNILNNQPWGGWRTLKDPTEPYAFHEVIFPSYKFRSRNLRTQLIVPVRFEVASEYMVHDSDDGEASLDLLISESQVAKAGGIARKPMEDTLQREFLITGRHHDYKYPEREPKPITEEARRYGLTDYGFHWRPKAMQPSHRFKYDSRGNLVEASIAFNTNPMDDPIYASNWLRYSAEEDNPRTALMAFQGATRVLTEAFSYPNGQLKKT